MNKIILSLLAVLLLAGAGFAGNVEGPRLMTSGGTPINFNSGSRLLQNKACTSDVITAQGFHWLTLFEDVVDSNDVGTDSICEVNYIREVPSKDNPDTLRSHVYSPDSTGALSAAGNKSYLGEAYSLAWVDGDTLRTVIHKDIQNMKFFRIIQLQTAQGKLLHRTRYMLYKE